MKIENQKNSPNVVTLKTAIERVYPERRITGKITSR